MRLPVVLTRDEVRRVLAGLDGVPRLVAGLLYGGGLRLLEALALRVKDIDLERREITVRRGKGDKDRVTVLPDTLVQPLTHHLVRVKALHDADLARGLGCVALPNALRAKYPNADRAWPWQFGFPATLICRDPRCGQPTRFHLHESLIQRAMTGPCDAPACPRAPAATHSATRSRRTCSRAATTSGRSRSCSDTPT